MTEGQRILALTFAWNLSKALGQSPRLSSRPVPPLDELIWAECSVPVSGRYALLSFAVFNRWWEIAPVFRCESPWIKRDIDWHVGKDGMMCWIHDSAWADGLTQFFPSKSAADILPLAVAVCSAHVRHLLSRHVQGDELRLEKWPTEWGQFSHGKKGTEEYLREKREFLRDFRKSYRMTTAA